MNGANLHLSESEIEAVLQVRVKDKNAKLSTVEYKGGSLVCMAGSRRLFASGGRQSYDHLLEEAQNLSVVKEVARLVAAELTDTPHGAKWLAQAAGVDVEYTPVIRMVLQKLAACGKIAEVDVEGKTRWALKKKKEAQNG